jgi:hypothetical protein
VNKRDVFTAAVTIGIAAAASAQIALRPGQYEVTAEMQLPGAPAPMKVTDTDCITPEEASDLPRLMMQENDSAESCKVSNVQMTGNKITFDTMCEMAGGSTTGRSEMTFAADSFTGTMSMQMGAQTVTSKLSGKWVRATCTDD